jgi:hypothetical protein
MERNRLSQFYNFNFSRPDIFGKNNNSFQYGKSDQLV